MQTDTITLRELTIRYTVKTDATGEPVVVGRKVSTPADSAAVFTTMLQDEASEVFAMTVSLDQASGPRVSRGQSWMSRLHTGASARGLQSRPARECRSIVLAHNHPSGDPDT